MSSFGASSSPFRFIKEESLRPVWDPPQAMTLDDDPMDLAPDEHGPGPGMNIGHNTAVSTSAPVPSHLSSWPVPVPANRPFGFTLATPSPVSLSSSVPTTSNVPSAVATAAGRAMREAWGRQLLQPRGSKGRANNKPFGGGGDFELDEADVVFESPIGSPQPPHPQFGSSASPSDSASGIEIVIQNPRRRHSTPHAGDGGPPLPRRRFSQPHRDKEEKEDSEDDWEEGGGGDDMELDWEDEEDAGDDRNVSPITTRTVPDPPPTFKLPVSKSPIMDALCYCALQGWGLVVVRNERARPPMPALVEFLVTDFERYYRISQQICSKQNPTEDIGARVKALRRWFTNFPAKKARTGGGEFSLIVRANGVKKVRQLLVENARLLGLR